MEQASSTSVPDPELVPDPALARESTPTRTVHPLAWVPSLYFAMGTPLHAVTVVSAIMYKNLGLSNAEIALYTGSMYLPWVVKPLWAPLLEMYRSKRFFVLLTEVAMATTLGAVALSLRLPDYLSATLAFLWVTGFASATQDVAADGVYIAAMDETRQARYVGVQGIAWNASRLIASGLMVELTQHLHADLGLSWRATWGLIMGGLACIMLGLFLWHLRVLPAAEVREDKGDARGFFRTMGETWLSFLQKKQLLWMLAVVFFYRFGEGFIEKVGPLFLMDDLAKGGLGLDNAALGRINGVYATCGFLTGALGGGLFVARMTLKRSFWLLAIALNVPHLTYLYLSAARPESLALIAAVVTIEKLGYGFGSVGHMLYMMQQVAPGPYRTAHYAFATGVMGLSMMLTGMLSGVLQEWLGYREFFMFVVLASIPPVVLAWSAPFRDHTPEPSV
jgi:MFS transporter, PAT family, beta-lactamase induction signal transducer AmpG